MLQRSREKEEQEEQEEYETVTVWLLAVSGPPTPRRLRGPKDGLHRLGCECVGLEARPRNVHSLSRLALVTQLYYTSYSIAVVESLGHIEHS